MKGFELTEEQVAAHNERMKRWNDTPRLPAKCAGASNPPPIDKPPAQKKTLKIILPFRLPTWNMLLAANPWQRKKVRDWIHAAMSTLRVIEGDSLTQTELVLKPVLTASSIESYCQMITPKSSTKSGTAKSKRKKTRR